MRRKTLLTLSQVAREIGESRVFARKALHKVRWAYPPQGVPARWDPRVVDLIHAIRGNPHRQVEQVHKDWLSDYQKGT